ncbi:signal recognition particle-docking protein FtsY [Aliikangiella maris]|uniref:Signal recognition particle receptor FtsY n=2 Tax=Aliikangiella maris TaxID=3162458 RepID=A0ABV3MP08_9GAMM
MSDKSSEKKGLFSWFGSKKKSQKQDKKQSDNREQTEEASTQSIKESDDLTHNQAVDQILDSQHSEIQTESSEVSQPSSETPLTQTEDALDTKAENPPAISQPQEKPTKQSLFQRLKAGLSKTRSQFSKGLANLLLGQKEIDEDILEEVETLLLMADVGVDATTRIIEDLTEKSDRKELKDTQALMNRLKEMLLAVISPVEQPLHIPQQPNPFVILVVGVNGVGKTTTIGKMAHRFLAEGKSVMLAAGDTFRAAAVEQLKTWGERNNVPVVAQHTGADSASVIYDAVAAAKARNVDVVIADTAGRLHNKSNLMEELTKVKRVMQKVDAQAPHEIMLVVDACTGQNALVQAVEFNKAVNLNSVTITKLDGTAKGGVVFALADKLKLPIRFIGVGETKQDLRTFKAQDYIDALFDQ